MALMDNLPADFMSMKSFDSCSTKKDLDYSQNSNKYVRTPHDLELTNMTEITN